MSELVTSNQEEPVVTTRALATELFSAERLTNSINGNPRYKLHTSDGVFQTQSDASCSYDVNNIVRKIPHGETAPVTLHLTPAGRVWNITPEFYGKPIDTPAGYRWAGKTRH